MSAQSATRAAGGVRIDRSRWLGLGTLALVLVFLLASFGVATGSGYTQSLVLTAAVFAMLAVSLDLVAGITGLYSLGHAGLLALGAYTTTLLAQAGWNLFLLLPVCIVGVGLVGAVLGALSLRVSGLYFAIMTFIFTLVVTVLISDSSFTGGLQGLAGPLFPDFPPALAFLGSSLVWCVALLVLIVVGIVWSIRSSAFYPVLLAIRDAEPFAAANGARTGLIRVGTFALSAALAGMAGWAFSFLGFVSPGQFTWTVSVNVLVMVILGGINTRLGPLIGAVFVSAFPIVVAIDPFVQEIIFGCVFVAVIVLFPRGAMGVVDTIVRRFRPRRVPDAPVADEGPIADAELASLDEPVAQAADAPPALVAESIVFSYVRGVRALDGVDMRVRAGTIHGLIGPNGSGKSTLVSLISGQITPDSGTITAAGTRIERLGAAARPKRGIMRTFQTAVLVKELPTRENVTVGLYSRTSRLALRSLFHPLLPGTRREHRDLRTQADQALRNVGLEPAWRSARVADVPHGVEQLTQLAAATVAEPMLLILDEPLAGLSSREVEQVSQILHRLRHQGVTVLVVEHQTRFIFEMCDDVTVLAAGQLVKSGPAAEVRADERVREVYLGQ